MVELWEEVLIPQLDYANSVSNLAIRYAQNYKSLFRNATSSICNMRHFVSPLLLRLLLHIKQRVVMELCSHGKNAIPAMLYPLAATVQRASSLSQAHSVFVASV
jgi:hypothetical protein